MLNETDVFSTPLIKSLVGADMHRYRQGLSWERLCEHCSLYLVAKGELKFDLGGKKINVGEGEVALLRAGEWAFIKNDSPTTAELYYIAFTAEESALSQIKTVTRSPECLPLFKESVDAFRSKEPLCGLRLAANLFRALDILLSAAMLDEGEYSTLLRVRKAAQYVSSHIYESITVSRLCEVTGYSESHLRRLFIAAYATTPKAYILDRKLEQAASLLATPPERSVEEIADLLCFCTPSYFCYAYKKKYGYSPMEHKKKLKAKPMI